MELVEIVYQATRAFPKEELFGLTSQMRRAAVSVPSNIAEGAARAGARELLQFLSIASASLSELDTQTEIARRLGYITSDELPSKIDQTSALLAGLSKALRRKHA